MRSLQFTRPLVSVVSCCRNEIRTLDVFLESLDGQMHESFDIEIIFADGGSFDGTRGALEEFAGARPWVQVLDNPRRIASAGLNAAILASRGSVIIRMDAHTVYAADYIAACVEELERRKAAMVGGPMRMARGSYWQNAIGAAYHSTFFSGGSSVYDVHYEGPVDSVLYGCWPRVVIEKAGLFDENMVRNQDDELSLRITQTGGLIWQSSRIQCWYYPRRSLSALARQFFGYGFWKVYTMRKHQMVVRPRHVVPALTIAVFITLMGAASVSILWRTVLGGACIAYVGATCLACALLISRKRTLSLLPGLLLVFPTAHLAYGTGTLWGLLRVRVPR